MVGRNHLDCVIDNRVPEFFVIVTFANQGTAFEMRRTISNFFGVECQIVRKSLNRYGQILFLCRTQHNTHIRRGAKNHMNPDNWFRGTDEASVHWLRFRMKEDANVKVCRKSEDPRWQVNLQLLLWAPAPSRGRVKLGEVARSPA